MGYFKRMEIYREDESPDYFEGDIAEDQAELMRELEMEGKIEDREWEKEGRL